MTSNDTIATTHVRFGGATAAPAKAAINAATEAVIRTGQHPLLTDAIILLRQAREKVGAYEGRAK
jgi:hypothetical protein